MVQEGTEQAYKGGKQPTIRPSYGVYEPSCHTIMAEQP